MWNPAATTAALALLGVMIGASLQYASSRALEGRKQLTLQKSSAYVDFFKAIAHIAKHGPSGGLLASVAEAKVRICIYGSAEVVKILRDVEASGPVLVSPESHAMISKLLKEMRKDSGMNCKGIAETDLESIVFGNGFRQGTASAVPKVSAGGRL
jgi:hypothetical protein